MRATPSVIEARTVRRAKNRRGVREILNEVRWHPARNPSLAQISFKDRSSPNGFRTIRGDEMEELGRSSFTIRGTTIPYYKVFRIAYGDEVLLERES